MSVLGPIIGMPGVRTGSQAAARVVSRGAGLEAYLAGGKVIDGAKSRDSGNTSFLHILRAGTLMGKVTASGKFAPSIIGVITEAVSATGTTVTVSAAQATELVRRVGATGTLRLVGPPAAAGTVATFTETYSAVNTTTGAITVSGLNADLIAGAFVAADDGTYIPRTLIPDGWGVRVTDYGGTSVDVPFANFPIGGELISEQLINWPTDTSLQSWIVDQMNFTGHFVFDHVYNS
jgi:hypothetical protein